MSANQALDGLLRPTQAVIAQAQISVINAQDAINTAQAAVDRLKYQRDDADALRYE